MEMTPRRQALIDERLAESHRLMIDTAFELNDLVRLAIAASKDRTHRVYYPMDQVNETSRQWSGLQKRLTALAQRVESNAERFGTAPFDPEQPAVSDPTV